MKRNPSASMGDLLAPLFLDAGKQAHLTLAAVRSRWEEIVGPELARKCRPLRVRRGVLWVAAPDASWAYQLQFMRSELLHCLESVLGPSDIREIRFREGAVSGNDGDTMPAAPGPGAALDPPQPGEAVTVPVEDPLAKASQAISDPELRALFVRSLAKQRRGHILRNAGGASSSRDTRS